MVADSMAQMYERLTGFVPGARVIRNGAAVAAVTGVPVAGLNPVWLRRSTASVAAVSALLDEVAASGLPYSLQLRPASARALAEAAGRRGMTAAGEIPVMTLGKLAVAIRQPRELSIRELAPQEAPVHAQVAAAGFGAPEDIFLMLARPDILRDGVMRCYLGEVNGQPVTTALAVTAGAFTGIFDVATLPGFRRRGFGAAVTAKAAADALAAGTAWCWLQSSAAGYSAYQTIGFHPVESWQNWVMA